MCDKVIDHDEYNLKCNQGITKHESKRLFMLKAHGKDSHGKRDSFGKHWMLTWWWVTLQFINYTIGK